MDRILKTLSHGIKRSSVTNKHQVAGIISAPVEATLSGKAAIAVNRIAGDTLITLEDDILAACYLKSFEDLKDSLGADIIENIKSKLKYSKPTQYARNTHVQTSLFRIQEVCIPLAINGRSFIVNAPTGSGKTMAYLLPILHMYNKSRAKALILTPTEDLVHQIRTQLLLLGSKAKTSSVKELKTKKSREESPDIIICTTSLVKLVSEKSTLLSDISFIVLDEVDFLLGEGNLVQVDKILSHCHKQAGKQIMMCSATLPNRVLQLANSVLHDALVIQVGIRHAAEVKINQEIVEVAHEAGKMLTLKSLVFQDKLEPPCIIFVQENDRAVQLEMTLRKLNIKVGCIHSGMAEPQRIEKMVEFRRGEVRIEDDGTLNLRFGSLLVLIC